MVKYWPYTTKLQVRDAKHLQQIFTWAYENGGDTAYQHWSSTYSHPSLTVYFCDHQLKVAFDLTFT